VAKRFTCIGCIHQHHLFVTVQQFSLLVGAKAAAEPAGNHHHQFFVAKGHQHQWPSNYLQFFTSVMVSYCSIEYQQAPQLLQLLVNTTVLLLFQNNWSNQRQLPTN